MTNTIVTATLTARQHAALANVGNDLYREDTPEVSGTPEQMQVLANELRRDGIIASLHNDKTPGLSRVLKAASRKVQAAVDTVDTKGAARRARVDWIANNYRFRRG